MSWPKNIRASRFIREFTPVRSAHWALDARRIREYQAHWSVEPEVTADTGWNGELLYDGSAAHQPEWFGRVKQPYPGGVNRGNVTLAYYPEGGDVLDHNSVNQHFDGPAWLFTIVFFPNNPYTHTWLMTEDDPDDPDPRGTYTYFVQSGDFAVYPGWETLTIVGEGE